MHSSIASTWPGLIELQISTNQQASSLSAVAPSFSPAPPPPDASTLDYFAQTGASQDDLFDDFTPVNDSMRVRSEDDLFSDDFTPADQPPVDQAPVQQPPQQPVGGREVGRRVRGRGRGRGAGRGAVDNTVQAQSSQQNGQTQLQRQATPPDNAPTGPRKEPINSVRGDRQATGGIKKPKLTEDELAEKMAKIQIKNANLTAAHARAEADAASFAEQEEQAKLKASQKSKEERRDRQQMMGERERNRMRKLKAMEGREWDAEKNEDDFRKGGRQDQIGGFAGDKEDYTDGREYLYQEPRGGQRRPRGANRERPPHPQTAPKQEEFPALPAANKPAATGASGKSWADQVESST